MDAGRREGWKALRRWLLWWQVDPAELAREVEGYGRLRPFFAARRLGFLVAVIAAALAAFLGTAAYTPMNHVLNSFAFSALAASACYLVLGWLMLRGNRAAMAGLMALSTASSQSVGASTGEPS